MRIIAISNHKGGVGKTTTAANLGVSLSKIGKKVMLIDLDPQSNLTNLFCVEQPKGTITDVFQDMHKELNIIKLSDSLDLVASSLQLTRIDEYLNQKPKKEYALKKIIDRYKSNYDYIILDCPPALSIVTINAFVCATEIIITLTPEALSIKGLNSLLGLISAVKTQYNSDLKLSGILLTRYTERKRIHRTISDLITRQYGTIIFTTKIRDNVAISESQLFNKDIFTFSPKSNGAIDYKNFAKEVANMKVY